MKYACEYCGGLYKEKDEARGCEMVCQKKACDGLGHDWGYYWSCGGLYDKVFRQCRRCMQNGGEAELNYGSVEVQGLMAKMWETAMKEAGK